MFSVQRRRRFAAAETQRLVRKPYEPGMAVSLVARRQQVSPSLLFRCHKLAASGALSAAQADEAVARASQVQALQQQVKELQRLRGKKTMSHFLERGGPKKPGGSTPQRPHESFK